MLTHKEATKDDRTGFASECPGALRHQGDFEDLDYTTVPPRSRTVAVYLCDCDHIVSLCEGRVLNVYARPPLRRLAADLAGRLDAGRP